MAEYPMIPIRQAPAGSEVVLTCPDLEAAIAFYTEHHGFRLDMIMPADAPRIARISGHGLSLVLERTEVLSSEEPTTRLRIVEPDTTMESDPQRVHAGVRVEHVGERIATWRPPMIDGAIVTRASAAKDWSDGRAGMAYRDLIPGRLGGSIIASQIRIADAGPVDDYVHYHHVALQMIYCRRGWVRVVYEDQGPPFVLREGDCVLQPPTIRHRVLESSAGLEVIEIGAPAEHETWRDHDLGLPNDKVDPDRRFDGQHFVRHVAAAASWHQDGEAARWRDLGIATATGGLATARVVVDEGVGTLIDGHAGDGVVFLFVLAGVLRIDAVDAQAIVLEIDDTCILPGDRGWRLTATPRAEWLELRVPGTTSRVADAHQRPC